MDLIVLGWTSKLTADLGVGGQYVCTNTDGGQGMIYAGKWRRMHDQCSSKLLFNTFGPPVGE